MNRANEVQLPNLSTCAIMEWVDENPEYYLDHTIFSDGHSVLIASEYQPTDSDIELDEMGLSSWHSCPNGWERENTIIGMWVCRKGERYIYITN